MIIDSSCHPSTLRPLHSTLYILPAAFHALPAPSSTYNHAHFLCLLGLSPLQMPSVLRSLLSARCPQLSTLYSLLSALFPLLSSRCSLLFALCSLLSALCLSLFYLVCNLLCPLRYSLLSSICSLLSTLAVCA
jgi:hypothetical protein